MYPGSLFEASSAFILLRPIIITLLVIAMIAFIILLFAKNKQKIFNGYTITGLSIILVVLAAQVLFYTGYLADELGLGGDEISFFLCLGIGVFSLVNIIIYVIVIVIVIKTCRNNKYTLSDI